MRFKVGDFILHYKRGTEDFRILKVINDNPIRFLIIKSSDKFIDENLTVLLSHLNIKTYDWHLKKIKNKDDVMVELL